MKKNFALRIDAEVYDAIERWAADEFRSTNGQIEWIIAEALKKAKRMPKPKNAIKKIVVFLLMNVGLACQAQWWTGFSEATHLVMCIHAADSSVELYSPMQTSRPIPVSSWSREADRFSLECKGIGLKMSLTQRDSVYVGYWKQGLLEENITFYPDDTLFQLRRPQTPEVPYRFDEETVATDYVDSQGNKVHLEGTLSYPKGGSGRYPTMVIVSGSGQQNRDEELLSHKPFLVLADYLASRGIALLRYDDRGVGGSKGNLDKATTALFSEDAEAMFRAVKSHPRVDTHRLGMGGHSEGGTIAPMVAARNSDVAFVVMLAGPGCVGSDVLDQQIYALMVAEGVSDTLAAIRRACNRDLTALPEGSKKKDYKAVIDRHTAGLTAGQIDSIGLGRGAAHAAMQQLSMPWMRAFLVLDPAECLRQVECPVLALNGAKDRQVLSAPNLERIKQSCPQADCRELPGLNHLFQHCATGASSEYVLIEETFAPEAMQAVADFILNLPKDGTK